MSQRIFANPVELEGTGADYVLALGTFDGVHLGHQQLLKEMLAIARRENARPAVLFFDPLPRTVIHPENPPCHLTSTEERVRLLQQFGVSDIIRFPFNQELAKLSPQEFLDRYFFQSPTCPVKAFCVGEDWRFGCRNSGTCQTLKDEASKHGIAVCIVPQLTYRGEPVSSTRIRQAIADGNLPEARQMLGRPVTLTGRVQHGCGLATSSLACPTANLPPDGQQLPPQGVYAATCVLEDGTSHPAIAYVGSAPTFRGDNADILVEIHLLDFQASLYDTNLRLELAEFLRPSRHFPTPEALSAQIQQDIARCQSLFHGA